jgi:hypothetical protein
MTPRASAKKDSGRSIDMRWRLRFSKKLFTTAGALAILFTVLYASRHAVVFGKRGVSPSVRLLFYLQNPKAFRCGQDYYCKSCPVGNHDRVIRVPNSMKAYRIDSFGNAYFACLDINMLVPSGLAGEDHDVFICSREPMDGTVILDRKTFHCADFNSHIISGDLGTIAPGETKSVELPPAAQPRPTAPE